MTKMLTLLPPMPRRAIATLNALAFMAGLGACGGDDAAPTPPSPPPPPAAASTTVSGAVVKGPVSGAQVCAFAVAGSARGAALGSCTTTDTTGNYSFAVPVGSGALWLEATGGSYVDEVTRAAVALPAGSALVSLATANGSSVTTMLTPLTTLALNAARASVGATGMLDTVAFQAAATQLLSTFNLPATLNLSTLLPTFGSGINAYGTALTVISQMVANGSTLAAILATVQPSTLAAAYATAAAAPVIPPVTPPVVNNATASGTLSFTGGNAAAAPFGNFTPQADGFEVTVKSGAEEYSSNLNQPSTTVYRFYKSAANSAGVATQVQFTVTRSSNPRTDISIRYTEGSNVLGSCNGCGTLSTPSGATRPVTLSFVNARLNTDLTVNGSVVGDAVGALWSPAELPGTTVGDAALSGVAFGATDALVNGSSDGAKFLLADGTLLEVLGNTANLYGRLGVYSCFSNCGITAVANAGGGGTFSFANSRLALPNNGSADPAGRTLTGSISIGKSSGQLTTTSLGGFLPTASTVQAVNGAVGLSFTRTSAGEGAGVVSMDAATRAGQVVSVRVTLGFAGNGQTYACAGSATPAASSTVPACSGITLSSNGLGLSFTNITLGGSLAVGGVLPTQTFNGSVAAKGR